MVRAQPTAARFCLQQNRDGVGLQIGECSRAAHEACFQAPNAGYSLIDGLEVLVAELGSLLNKVIRIVILALFGRPLLITDKIRLPSKQSFG